MCFYGFSFRDLVPRSPSKRRKTMRHNELQSEWQNRYRISSYDVMKTVEPINAIYDTLIVCYHGIMIYMIWYLNYTLTGHHRNQGFLHII